MYNFDYISGLVQQATDALPKALSGRFLLFVWWLFVMILITMYTANLTAHLTLERSDTGLAKVEDLLRQDGQDNYRWGFLGDVSFESMMENSNEPDYRELAKKADRITNTNEALQRVSEGLFVYMEGDSSSLLPYTNSDCNLVQTNMNKFHNQWALGVQFHSPYTEAINKRFLIYREEGWFVTTFQNWYKSDSGIEDCSKNLMGNNTKFSLQVLRGLFLILIIGIGVSFIIVILEIIHASYIDSRHSGTFCSSIKSRLHLKLRDIAEDWFGIGIEDVKSGKKFEINKDVIMNNAQE